MDVGENFFLPELTQKLKISGSYWATKIKATQQILFTKNSTFDDVARNAHVSKPSPKRRKNKRPSLNLTADLAPLAESQQKVFKAVGEREG